MRRVGPQGTGAGGAGRPLPGRRVRVVLREHTGAGGVLNHKTSRRSTEQSWREVEIDCQGIVMDPKRFVHISKYLSKHLRHQPERLGLRLEAGGWVSVEDLLAACAAHRLPL